MEATAARLFAAATVVGIVLGAALVWVALPGASPIDCNPGGSGSTPLGTAFALNTPEERTVGSDHWYNFSIGASTTGIRFDNFNFQVQTSSGAVQDPGPGWTLTVTSDTGGSLAAYSLVGATAGTWTFGGSATVLSQDSIDLLATPTSLSGDQFILIEGGTYADGCPDQGSVSVSIP